MKFTTREGSTAAYGENTFRIQNVILVTSLLDTTSKRRDEHQRRKQQPKDFESVLKQACSQQEQNEISCATSGYTRMGLPYYYVDKRREYARL